VAGRRPIVIESIQRSPEIVRIAMNRDEADKMKQKVDSKTRWRVWKNWLWFLI